MAYGFSAIPAAITHALEIHCPGIQIVRHVGERRKDVSLSRRYVASCRSSIVGFSSTLSTIPRLDDTPPALEPLTMVDAHSPAADEQLPAP